MKKRFFVCWWERLHSRLRKGGNKKTRWIAEQAWNNSRWGIPQNEGMRWKVSFEMCQGEGKQRGQRKLWRHLFQLFLTALSFFALFTVFLLTSSCLPSLWWSLLSAAILSPAVFVSFQRQIPYSLLSRVALGFCLTTTSSEAEEDVLPSWELQELRRHGRGRIGERGDGSQLRAFVISLWSAEPVAGGLSEWCVFLYPRLTITTGVY